MQLRIFTIIQVFISLKNLCFYSLHTYFIEVIIFLLGLRENCRFWYPLLLLKIHKNYVTNMLKKIACFKHKKFSPPRHKSELNS
jgi:hypothetical protein